MLTSFHYHRQAESDRFIKSRALSMADNPRKDFFGARQLGMYTIQFKHFISEYGNHQPQITDHYLHLIVDSLAEILGSSDKIESLL